MRLIDLTGQKFGNMRVLSRAEGPFRGTWWNCICDCGEELVRNSTHLRQENTHSGCRLNYSDEALLRSAASTYKLAAKKRGLEWKLSEEQVFALFTSDCTYCKAPPGNLRKGKGGHSVLYSGIDRVDNTRGYVPDNVAPCCGPCNIAKGTRSVKEFLAWAHQVARNSPEPPFTLTDLTERDRSRHAVIDDVLELYAE